MITGVALAGVGVILTMAGFVVCSSHLLSATRRWMRELEVPPSELAKLKWAQARAAAAAGGSAWQQVPNKLQQVPTSQRARAAV
jgi:hypothetical protein